MNERYIQRVIDDCRWYAETYGCTLADALADWEGDGPYGPWGLTPEEVAAVSKRLEAA